MPLTAIELAMRRMKQNEKKKPVKQTRKGPVVKKVDEKKPTHKKVATPTKVDFKGKIITVDVKHPIHVTIKAKLVSTVTDGNCFFHSLSMGLTQFGIHKSIGELRNEIADYIDANKELYSMLFEGMDENKEYRKKDEEGNVVYRIDTYINDETGKVFKSKVPEKISFKKFVNNIRTTKMYVDQLELSAVCDLYKINLIVVDVATREPTLTNFDCQNNIGDIYIYHTKPHYELLVDVESN